MLRTRREREADPATEDPPARLGSTDGGMHYVKAQQNAQTYFKTALCTRRMTGQCVRGFACTYTHGVEKLRTKRLGVQRDPRYKTQLRQSFFYSVAGTCHDPGKTATKTAPWCTARCSARRSATRPGSQSEVKFGTSNPVRGGFSSRSGRSRSGGPGGARREAKFAGSGGRQILLGFQLTNVSNRSILGSQEAPGRFGPFWGLSGGAPGRDGSEGPTTDAETTNERARVERHVRSDTRR